MTLAHLNVNSIRNKVDQLEVFMNAERPDIVCFTEHHLQEHERGIITFENFYEGSAYCRRKKSRGGTIIYLGKQIKSKQLSVRDLIEEGNIEICAVKLLNVKVIVACVYRPPSGSHQVFFKNFQKLIDRLCKDDSAVFICGDFNIDLMAQKSRKDRYYKNKFLQILKLHRLEATIDTPTRESESSKTLIDNVFTNLDQHFLML